MAAAASTTIIAERFDHDDRGHRTKRTELEGTSDLVGNVVTEYAAESKTLAIAVGVDCQKIERADAFRSCPGRAVLEEAPAYGSTPP